MCVYVCMYFGVCIWVCVYACVCVCKLKAQLQMIFLFTSTEAYTAVNQFIYIS